MLLTFFTPSFTPDMVSAGWAARPSQPIQPTSTNQRRLSTPVNHSLMHFIKYIKSLNEPFQCQHFKTNCNVAPYGDDRDTERVKLNFDISITAPISRALHGKETMQSSLNSMGRWRWWWRWRWRWRWRRRRRWWLKKAYCESTILSLILWINDPLSYTYCQVELLSYPQEPLMIDQLLLLLLLIYTPMCSNSKWPVHNEAVLIIDMHTPMPVA
jgi:hypothetical protein